MSGNNGVSFYASYVAGLDPAKENDKFMAFITIEEGTVKIAYSPELNAEEKALRKYTTWGKKSLLDANWTEVPEGHEAEYNFFKVSVGMR